MTLTNCLFGGVILSADRRDTEAILNVCMHGNLVYRKMRFSGDCLVFECSMYTASLLLGICRERGIGICVMKKYGLPHILYKYRKRIGILAGLLLASAVIIISERFVWDIRVTGCENIAEEAVILQLRDQNFGIGSYIPGADIDVIENRLLIYSQDIAWISINLRGSVAYVELREKLPEPPPPEKRPANLVASWDGQIESIAAEGVIMVRVGQHVRRGGLLVSGIYDSRVLGYRYTRASGTVMAKTVRTLRVEIPFCYEVRSYTGEEFSNKTLIFFSKEIKLYRKTGFLGETYDTISTTDNISLPGGARLPLSIQTVTYRPYTTGYARRGEAEATELAYAELDRQIDEILAKGATLLRKNISWSSDGESFVLECTVSLIENIAETVEFEVSE